MSSVAPPEAYWVPAPKPRAPGTAGADAGWIVLSIVAILISWFLNLLAGGQWLVRDAPLDPRSLWGVAGLLAGFFVPLLLLLRSKYPLAVTLACAGAVVVLPTSVLPAAVALSALLVRRSGGWAWGAVALVYAAAVWSALKDVWAPISLVAGIASGDSTAGLPEGSSLPFLAPVIAAVLLLPFVAVGVARDAYAQRDTASQRSVALARSTEVLHDQVARDRERQAAAREIHDTLASRLSALSLNAGALELTVAESDGESARAARAVRESAQASLDDLRHVVQVLRNPAAADSGKTIADLRQLIDEAHSTGDPVRSSVMVDAPATCPPDVAHAAYRVAQESLSNARRHAPGAPVTVRVHGGPAEGLEIRIVNDAPRNNPQTVERGTGHGVLGMRERVLLVGGDFDARPSTTGGFTVSARIPWR